MFYYNAIWSSDIGYPAGYGQDSGLDDKQFHWVYFIDAAAFDRNDTIFSCLRNFSPYASHSICRTVLVVR
ncbi:MAG: hypothetical protein AUK44_05610 [Porphyromonadaceae bacterium CG2_30_38_12]|nr:MAG: hypothetical protein AUK44_05610 [Porphyromonadaceae bacterium CG2_30_38_12]